MLGKLYLHLWIVIGLGVASVAVAGEPGRFVGTPSDPWIPNFAHPEVAAGPIITSLQPGAWSDPETWGGATPEPGDVVVIEHDVLFGTEAEVEDVVVYPGGKLWFQTERDTRLTLRTLQVLEGGALEIGRRTRPVAAGVLAEIVFLDRSIDTAVDPGQYGNGLIVSGEVTLHGAPAGPNFARLAVEPKAGDVELVLSDEVTGWRPGGRIVLADSRQADPRLDNGFVSQTEVVEIADISPDGRTLTLAAELAHDHPGARNAAGELDFLPHAAYLSSNLVLRSDNPTGTRGHGLLLFRAQVDIRYTLFQDLGRTTAEELDATLFDEEGNATHIGTNQPGRYPIHTHHVSGPEDTPDIGYQFALIGNAIDGGPDEHLFKWGIAVHASHYGLVRGNTVFNYAGSGIVTEDGSESYNLFDRNFVARCSAFGNLDTQDRGTAGTAFWFRGQNNFVRDNVAADARNSGFSINAYRLGDVEIPVAPGSLERTTIDMNTLPILELEGNESYGPSFRGLDLWEIGSTGETLHDAPRSIVGGQRVWHHFDRALTVYRTHRVTYDRLTIRGDVPQLDSRFVDPIGLHLSNFYRLRGHRVTRADIQGQRVGIDVDIATIPDSYVGDIGGQPSPQDETGEVVIQDSTLANYINISVATRRNLGSPRRTVVCDTDFAGVDVDPDGQNTPQYDLIRDYEFGLDRNLVSPDEVVIFNRNRNPDDDFDLFSLEQAPDFIVPKTSDDGRQVGSPVEGLTNEENWAQFGIAVGAEIATCLDAETRPEVAGFTCFLDGTDGSNDVTPPTSPAWVSLDPAGTCIGEARLTWTPSCDDDSVFEYIVERDGEDISVTPTRDFRETELSPGTYRYQIRARDSAGNESTASSPVDVVIPTDGCE